MTPVQDQSSIKETAKMMMQAQVAEMLKKL